MLTKLFDCYYESLMAWKFPCANKLDYTVQTMLPTKIFSSCIRHDCFTRKRHTNQNYNDFLFKNRTYYKKIIYTATLSIFNIKQLKKINEILSFYKHMFILSMWLKETFLSVEKKKLDEVVFCCRKTLMCNYYKKVLIGVKYQLPSSIIEMCV